ncbi:DUF2480 family protein [Crocinitomix catalasitica]|uniref:DUF2480 family protein n=1 Tax=Crocinitomix catalasitica TaxID=184607 RepID=UPI000485C390|nr:DUF2480 family protein [Crocinitomix catalasitica]
MEEEIVNKVAGAQIEQIDLKSFVNKSNIVGIDLKDLLWEELVLKEKDFRDWVKTNDWSQYNDQIVHLYCSNDAIIPAWSYMLLMTQLSEAKQVIFGDIAVVEEELFFQNLANWNIDDLNAKRVMVKGCSTIPNPNKAYVELTKKLMPTVKSLMFGEPCSAVPVFKQARR